MSVADMEADYRDWKIIDIANMLETMYKTYPIVSHESSLSTLMYRMDMVQLMRSLYGDDEVEEALELLVEYGEKVNI